MRAHQHRKTWIRIVAPVAAVALLSVGCSNSLDSARQDYAKAKSAFSASVADGPIVVGWDSISDKCTRLGHILDAWDSEWLSEHGRSERASVEAWMVEECTAELESATQKNIDARN